MASTAPRVTSVNQPPSFPARCAPADGDLVVAREGRSSTRYTLRRLPGVVQLSTADRGEALRLARGFAAAHRLAVWYRDGEGYRLVESFRGSTGGAP